MMESYNWKPRLLVIDDEENMRHMLSSMLRSDFDIELAESGAQGLSALARSRKENLGFDFILCDIRMPGMNGIEFIEKSRSITDDAPVIIMSAYGSMDTAIEAMKKGAYDYISKPFRKDELVLVLRKAMEREALKKENYDLRQQIAEYQDKNVFGGMIGRSRIMQNVFFLARRAAESDVSVLITGESGTGKELVAKAVHSESRRSGCPLVSVNCGAIPENLVESEFFGHVKGSFTGAASDKKGLFAEADGGTLFLDEVGELPSGLQVSLLRVLQEREVRPVGSVKTRKIDVRVIAATSRNLEAEISRGTFREDLYYRLNVLNINMPPLRERIEDIPYLCVHFIRKSNARIPLAKCKSIGSDAIDLLSGYRWPGNIRELENKMERAVLLCDGEKLHVSDFPDILKKSSVDAEHEEITGFISDSVFSIKEAQKKIEAFLIVRALEKCGGNRTKAARLLEISHPSLLMKIKNYNIDL